ncbi:GNAT family N-acetyltransferase [Micromonospora sp. WMMC250]|uniref:GNAT family N-acetyltransferase n=1 Tax=Micromonospora sp. WMMC250 TaxID=3014781 RepID=UPI0022B65866|nr:GNAT family protein [Micromonospora sp. WMMC250]MCZ7374681.1 GNAT family protein [Micromonospora sp. WMMC250]
MIDLSHKPTLTGNLVTLRPPTADDAEAMTAVMADPDVARLTGSVTSSADLGVPPPLERSRDWYGSRGAADDRLDLVVVDKATDRVVGEVVLNSWDPDARSVNFRTMVGPEGRGRGLGTEAARLVLGYAFDQVGMHRVGLEVFDFNPRARHVYEKIGFVHEGTRRHALCFDGDWVDAHDMSILEHEWADHRGNS